MGSKKTGIAILSTMGFLWCLIGAVAFPYAWRMVVALFAFLILVALLYATARKTSAPTKLDGKIFGMSLAFEIGGIIAAVWLLNSFHEPTFILPAITVIVGLHFIGMWFATDNVTYIQIAIAMCGVGPVSAILPFPIRMQVAGLSSAVILWAGAAVGLSKRFTTI